MKHEALCCQGCREQLVLIEYSDLLANRARFSTNEIESLSPLLRLFAFYVCATCGCITIQGNKEIRALAEDLTDETGGHS